MRTRRSSTRAPPDALYPISDRGSVLTGRVAIWARPNSSTDRLAWDPWRKRWVVSCRAAPIHGEANDSIALLVTGWLGLPRDVVRWVRAGSSATKLLEVDGLTDSEISRRLNLACEDSGR